MYERPENFEKEALANWESGVDATKNQAEREKEDLSWQVPENQWDDAARTARGRNTVGGVGIPARPMLSIPKIKQPMSIVDNQFRSADLDVNIHAISEDADDDTAEVYQDLYRAWITRDSNAKQVRWWAFDRAKQAGRGWYRFNTVYDDASPDPFDQKVVLERILYQSAVVMDPSAIKPDYSDANWGFLSAWLPIEVFKRRWPEARVSKNEEAEGIDGMKLDDLCSSTPNWVKDGDKKAIQVAEYWKKCYLPPEKVVSPDGKTERYKEKYVLMWYVLAPGGPDGLEVVEEQEWNGDLIPLIPAIGNELQPFDDERRWEGMVRPSRDGQKLYNFTASTAVEKMGTLPKSPWMVDVESIEGYEDVWAQSNTRILAYQPYRGFKDGRQLEKPYRMDDNGQGLTPIMILLQQADEFIQATTATPDPVLGKRNSKSESGRAIQALQGQSEASNSSYIQNFADITMMYEARVGIGMIKRVCDRPGRVVSALNIQGEGRKLILNQDFVMENGKPRPVTPQAPGMPLQGPTPAVKKYDLSKGYYGVSVTIGKSFNTKREQGVELLNAIMERAPELGIVLAPVMLRFMDGPGMKEAAELAKEFRDKQFPGMGASKDGQETPEQLKSMLQAAKQQIEQMQQAGQEMQRQLEMDQAKAQADLAKVQVKAEADGQNAQAEAMLKAALAEIEAKAAERLAEIEAAAELKRQDDQQAFEMAKLGLEQRFEALQNSLDRASKEAVSLREAENARAESQAGDGEK
jgi:hypothetical protein